MPRTTRPCLPKITEKEAMQKSVEHSSFELVGYFCQVCLVSSSYDEIRDRHQRDSSLPKRSQFSLRFVN